jgi:hypothetical protein
MGSNFFYKDLETVERGGGYAFKQNHRLKLTSFLKLQLMQMCAKKESWWETLSLLGYLRTP